MNEQTLGRGMAADIAEQPDMYARLVQERGTVAEVAKEIARRQPRHVLFTARGTSDHAALYAAYLTEIRLGIPAGLVSPSAITIYGARPDLRDCLVVGVSQSGGSPDLVEVVRVAREQGAHTLAVTNAPGSPLADAAELHLDIAAGAERAVAATKTYTAELLTLLLLVEGTRTGDGTLPSDELEALAQLPELASDGAGRSDRCRDRRQVPVRRAAGHHRAGVRVPDRSRGRIEADGNLVRGRAGVLRRRPATRPARHGRCGRAGAGCGRQRAGRAVDA